MPFARPSLTTLIGQAAADLVAALPVGAAPLLRFNNLGIMGRVQARFTNGLYGRLDWIARQGVPWTADDPAYTASWGALRGVQQKGAVAATGSAPVLGTNGVVVPAGTSLTRPDGAGFVTTADTIIAAGVASCPVTATAAGAAGNTAAGVTLTLTSPIAGATSLVTLTAAIGGGVDAELPAAFRTRYLQRYATPPQAGTRGDYVAWATALPQVTRAWVSPGAAGTGLITVYVMLDALNAASGGFPVGVNGVASGDPRYTAATGDQLAVANALFTQQPATPLVVVCSPIAAPVNLTVTGMPALLQPKVAPAIQALFATQASPGGVWTPDGSVAGLMPMQRIWLAVFQATGFAGFLLPGPDIQTGTGQLVTLGTLTFQ